MNDEMPNLYIDMDGVVADFNGFASTVLREPVEFSTEKWTPEQWAKLRDYPCLYRYLPKMPRADEVIALARLFKNQLGWGVFMLTAVPKGNDVPDAFHDKIRWMQKYYPDIAVRFGPFAKNKKDHCKPGDVLFDDRVSNCEEWVLAGGRAILAKNMDHALLELKSLFEDQRAKNT